MELPEDITKVKDVLDYLKKKIPEFNRMFLTDYLVLMGDHVLLLPKDEELLLIDDIFIAPIISGG